jgi:hypothetical protein
MVTPSLASRLGALRDLPLARAFLEDYLTQRGPAAVAKDLEPLLQRAALGVQAERDAVVPVASWIAHVLARGEADKLLAIGAAADAVEQPIVRATFAHSDAERALPPRGRLAEVSVPVFGDLAGTPFRCVGESKEEWQRRYAWMQTSAAQAWMMRDRRRLFRMHHEPVFIRRLLDQRWVSTGDVVIIAARRPTVPAIVLAIATRDRWLCCAPVREALAENPYTPAPLSRVLAHAGATSPFLRRLARASRAA